MIGSFSFSPQSIFPARPMGLTHFGARVTKNAIMEEIIRTHWEQKFAGKTMTTPQVWDFFKNHWKETLEALNADPKKNFPSFYDIRKLLNIEHRWVKNVSLQSHLLEKSSWNPTAISFQSNLNDHSIHIDTFKLTSSSEASPIKLKPLATLIALLISKSSEQLAGKSMNVHEVHNILSTRDNETRPQGLESLKLPQRNEMKGYLDEIVSLCLFCKSEPNDTVVSSIHRTRGRQPSFFTFKPKEAFLQDAQKLQALLKQSS